jgi:SHS2 domain-containing protein
MKERKAFMEIGHTADCALRIWGSDLEHLFIHAVEGMLELAGAEGAEAPIESRMIKLNALDRESLLVVWLEELLFDLEVHKRAWVGMQIEIQDDTCLVACLTEAPLRGLKRNLKAVTYHDLEITKSNEGYETTVVFDI